MIDFGFAIAITTATNTTMDYYPVKVIGPEKFVRARKGSKTGRGCRVIINVPARPDQTSLDVMQYVQDNLDLPLERQILMFDGKSVDPFQSGTVKMVDLQLLSSELSSCIDRSTVEQHPPALHIVCTKPLDENTPLNHTENPLFSEHETDKFYRCNCCMAWFCACVDDDCCDRMFDSGVSIPVIAAANGGTVPGKSAELDRSCIYLCQRCQPCALIYPYSQFKFQLYSSGFLNDEQQRRQQQMAVCVDQQQAGFSGFDLIRTPEQKPRAASVLFEHSKARRKRRSAVVDDVDNGNGCTSHLTPPQTVLSKRTTRSQTRKARNQLYNYQSTAINTAQSRAKDICFSSAELQMEPGTPTPSSRVAGAGCKSELLAFMGNDMNAHTPGGCFLPKTPDRTSPPSPPRKSRKRLVVGTGAGAGEDLSDSSPLSLKSSKPKTRPDLSVSSLEQDNSNMNLINTRAKHHHHHQAFLNHGGNLLEEFEAI